MFSKPLLPSSLPVKRFNRGKALVIGNDKYVKRELWDPLQHGENDANAVEEALKLGQFPDTKKRANLCRTDMFELVDEFVGSLDNTVDCVWFHFSGHAVLVSAERNGGRDDLELVPVDSVRPEDNMKLTFILDRLTDNSKCQRLIMCTLDCCQTLGSWQQKGPSMEGTLNGILDVGIEEGDRQGSVGKRGRFRLNSCKRYGGLEIAIFTAGEAGRPVVDTGVFSQAVASVLKRENCLFMDFVTSVNALVTKQSNCRDQWPSMYMRNLSANYMITRRSAEGETCAHVDQSTLRQMLNKMDDQSVKALFLEQARKRKLQLIYPPKRVLIVFDGLIGCGKTTLLNQLKTNDDIDVWREPIQKPASEDAGNSWWPLLVKLYRIMKKEPSPQEKEAATAELEETVWSHHSKIATQRCKDTFTERGPLATAKVFCKALHNKAMLAESKYNDIEGRYEALMKDADNHPTVTIYCQISVEEALQRVKERADAEGRDFEKGMDPAYLEELHDMYEELYDTENDTLIKVDSSQPPEQILQAIKPKLRDRLQKNQIAPEHLKVIMQSLGGEDDDGP